MEAKIQVKIKMDNDKEVILDQKEAKELFEKLREIFTKDQTYVPIWVEKWYPTYPYYPVTYKQDSTTGKEDCAIWYTSNNTAEVSYTN